MQISKTIVQGSWHWYKNILMLSGDVFNITRLVRSLENISKSLFHVIMSSTKIIEFDIVKFPKSISSKDGVWREYLEIDSNSTFSKKKWALCNREFSYSFFQSISYNNVVVTKQFFFSPIFLKSWIHISDNIAGVVGGPQDY